MLRTDDRLLLREAIRPPEGYELDEAIITTYSLDLLSLLTVPLFFTLFEVEGENGDSVADPLALLQALRRHAARLTVFCQAGEIAAPTRQRQLFGYLETSIVEVCSPRPNGVFHPKVWALRYTAPGKPVMYRLACFSRNLTPDRSWDTAVVLEGELQDRRVVGYSENRTLGEFFQALPAMAVRQVAGEIRERAAGIGAELRKVKFSLPEGFESLQFWPIGHDGRSGWPFNGRADRMLVVSPFVGAGTLTRLTDSCDDVRLVSRPDELDRLTPSALEGVSDVSVMADAVETESATGVTDEGAGSSLSGLHAKLFVIDHGWNGSILTGSANATNAAFQCNVEFLVELIGKRSMCGVEAVLSAPKGHNALGALLQPYHNAGNGTPADAVQEALEESVGRLARSIASLDLVLEVSGTASGRHRVEVRRQGGEATVPQSGMTLSCWPVLLPQTLAVPFGPQLEIPAVFPEVSVEGLTTFLAVRIVGEQEGRVCEKRFVLNLPLLGGPADRLERILRTVLHDRQRVLRFLLLLLGDLDAIVADEMALPGEGGTGSSSQGRTADATLLEPLVRALHRDPTKLDQIARLVEELRSGDGEDLLPPDFAPVWETVWAVRKEAGV